MALTPEEKRERYLCRSTYANVPASRLKLDPPLTKKEAEKYEQNRLEMMALKKKIEKSGKKCYFEMSPFD